VTFEFVAHTADIKVAIEARDLDELFADATELVRQLLVGPSPVRETQTSTIEITASDTTQVLLDYLRELLYRFEVEGFVASRVELTRATPTALSAVMHGEQFDPERHETQPEVKAVTQHELEVAREGTGWHAEVLFDV
jgi:SHS2 domain-containing protein